MTTVADALRYLIGQASGLSETNRAEFLDAVDAEYGAVPVPVPPTAEEERAAKIAALQAELGQLEAESPAGLGTGGQAHTAS